jgi:nitrate/nitrite transport system substrate-binding protein
MDRRRFLKLTGAAALTPAMAALLSTVQDARAEAASRPKARTGKTVRPVKLGFIALTDCASLVMAKELGYFADRDLDVTLEKQASWPATRDNLLTNQIDGAHALFSLPFSVATGIGGKAGDTSLKIAMVLNNNGQAITLNNDFTSAGYGNLKKVKRILETKTPTMAMTFPGGTHDTWLRYWLKAAKVAPGAVNIIPIPPPQMVANMKVGTMDGYCVGEPWGAVAVAQGVGFTAIATQDIWNNHPEKALVASPQFATQTDTLSDVMAAVLQASKWLDQRKHRAEAATTISPVGYVNAPATDIQSRLEGTYELGAELGTKRFKDNYMTFFRDGDVNFPRRSYAYWFMAQYVRLGLLPALPTNYKQLADSILLSDLYAKVATAEKVPIPDDDVAPFTVKLDNATFDPKQIAEETKRP